MFDSLQFVLFVIVNIFIFIRVLAYGLYEIKQENNKFGGITVIVFSLLVAVLSIFSLFSIQ